MSTQPSKPFRTFAPELNKILEAMEVPVRIVETPGQGKHMVALSDIVEGTELFEELPVASWPMDSFLDHGVPLCWWCLKVLRDSDQRFFHSRDEGNKENADPCRSPPLCSQQCLTLSATLFEIVGGDPQDTLRKFHQAHRRGKCAATVGEDTPSVPISVESVARCVAAMAHRLVSIVTSQGLTPSDLGRAEILRQVFDGATKTFNRFVEPPSGSEFEDVDVSEWVRVVQSTLSRPLTAYFVAHLLAGGGGEVGKATATAGGSGGGAEGDVVIPLLVDGLLNAATLLTIIGQLSLNAQALNTVALLPEGPAVVCVGGGLFALQSNCNHSCCPNAMVSSTAAGNHEIVLQTTRPIKAGEEICISYIPCEGKSLAERRTALRPYFFTCECHICVDEQRKTDGAGCNAD